MKNLFSKSLYAVLAVSFLFVPQVSKAEFDKAIEADKHGAKQVDVPPTSRIQEVTKPLDFDTKQLEQSLEDLAQLSPDRPLVGERFPGEFGIIGAANQGYALRENMKRTTDFLKKARNHKLDFEVTEAEKAMLALLSNIDPDNPKNQIPYFLHWSVEEMEMEGDKSVFYDNIELLRRYLEGWISARSEAYQTGKKPNLEELKQKAALAIKSEAQSKDPTVRKKYDWLVADGKNDKVSNIGRTQLAVRKMLLNGEVKIFEALAKQLMSEKPLSQKQKSQKENRDSFPK